ncbi:hypothetical protein GIB67_030468 [Kingdonia uniflora]|uniref:Bifunctional inhibitor/plant lipid transfer protein/seed storage helical domain-containing protein n=1 Tax=Kingdonia uniflora TaxID=39325 RepID=A0A7J7P7B8_9MAGN|nr:hypothetical protein GIB67_030468 [Kingdonia uniflora]
MGTMEADEKDCADELTKLAECIPYVSGTAKKPTQACCDDMKKVKSEKPKCLCVLIKESTDPSMGLPINTSLAMQMPTVCNIDDAKVSDCPSLLKLAPDSPDAKIFKDADSGTPSTTTTTTSPPSSATDSSSNSSSGSSSKVTPTSNDAVKMKLIEAGLVLGLMVSVAWTMA